jgi:hypothetical protein
MSWIDVFPSDGFDCDCFRFASEAEYMSAREMAETPR